MQFHLPVPRGLINRCDFFGAQVQTIDCSSVRTPISGEVTSWRPGQRQIGAPAAR
jgi:hypothetical protein